LERCSAGSRPFCHITAPHDEALEIAIALVNADEARVLPTSGFAGTKEKPESQNDPLIAGLSMIAAE
jgi:hypothetical protein|tara:strand:+ start:605 stop:805 length:201 start_codon:yes stop_codon:yes gene_type:complete